MHNHAWWGEESPVVDKENGMKRPSGGHLKVCIALPGVLFSLLVVPQPLLAECGDSLRSAASSVQTLLWYGPCATQGDCDDGNACTQDACLPTGSCQNLPLTGCCQSHADCDDADPCTLDACSFGVGHGHCEHVPAWPGCCTAGGASQCLPGERPLPFRGLRHGCVVLAAARVDADRTGPDRSSVAAVVRELRPDSRLLHAGGELQ
jgi:hypothetical protein